MPGAEKIGSDQNGISADDTLQSATKHHLSANTDDGAPLFDNLLTYTDLIPRTQIPKRTLERLVSKREIPCIRLGNQVRFYWPDVLEALRNQKGSRRR